MNSIYESSKCIYVKKIRMTEMVNLITSNYSHDKVYLSVCIFDTYKIKVVNNQITVFIIYSTTIKYYSASHTKYILQYAKNTIQQLYQTFPVTVLPTDN